jgi:cytochrome b involved in lipid metabolism
MSPNFKQENYEHLINLIETKQNLSEIINLFPKLIFVVYKNKVYDLSGYNHPGGNYIWANIQGKDITALLNGCDIYDGMSSLNIKHNHNTSALNYLDKRYIGTVDYPVILVDKNN